MRPGCASVLLVAALLGCSAKNAADTSTDSDLSVKLAAVRDGLFPAPLKSSSSELASRLASSSSSYGPCAGIEGSSPLDVFIKCQPNLVRAYLAQSATIFSAMVDILKASDEDIPGLKDGDSGQRELDGGYRAQWKRRASEDWDFLVTKSGAPAFQAEIRPTAWTLKFADSTGTKFETALAYTDGTHWKQTIRVTDAPCKSEEPNGPERVRIVVDRQGSLWTGKGMTYHPRRDNCSETPSDATAMNVHVDFVSDTTAAKAKVYMLARSVADLSSIATYSLARLCVNYPAYCGGSATSYESTIPNPFCFVAGSTTATWGSSCDSSSATVAATEFGSESLWVAPATFYQEAGVTLATGL